MNEVNRFISTKKTARRDKTEQKGRYNWNFALTFPIPKRIGVLGTGALHDSLFSILQTLSHNGGENTELSQTTSHAYTRRRQHSAYKQKILNGKKERSLLARRTKHGERDREREGNITGKTAAYLFQKF